MWTSSVNCSAFPGCTRGRYKLQNLIQLATKFGFESIELLYTEDGLISPETSLDDLHKIAKSCSSKEVPVSGVSTILNWKYPFTSNSQQTRRKANQYLTHMIRIASAFECGFVSISAGDVLPLMRSRFEKIAYYDAYKRACSFFQDIGQIAENNGVIVCLENVWSDFIRSPEDLLHLVEEISHPAIAVCLDIGNAQLFKPAEEWIAVLHSHLRRIHATDFQPTPSPQIVPIGGGVVNWLSVRNSLTKINYSDFVVTEHYYSPQIGLGDQLLNLSESLATHLPKTF